MLVLRRMLGQAVIVGDMRVVVEQIRVGMVLLSISENGKTRSRMMRMNERWDIAPKIQLTVVFMNSKHIGIGIDAPRSIPVDREEIVKRWEREAELAKRA